MPKPNLIYVEGYFKYTPTRIEKALENRLIANGLELAMARETPSWADGIFMREVPNLPNPLKFRYERRINWEQIKEEVYKTQEPFPDKDKYAIDLVQKLLRLKKTYDELYLDIGADGSLTLSFEPYLSDIYYDDIEDEAEAFLKEAFEKYTGNKFPRQKFPNRIYINPEIFTQCLVDSFEPESLKDRRKLYRRSSIDIVNMIVDEFACILHRT